MAEPPFSDAGLVHSTCRPAIIERAGREIVDRIEELVIRVSGRPGRHGARLIASMITGMLTSCGREAVAQRNDLNQAAALCESFLYAALR